MARPNSNKLLQMVDDGLLDKDTLIRDLIGYMSDDDVKQFCDANDIELEEEDEEEDEEDEEEDPELGCHGHESLNGPIGTTIYCDGKCRAFLNSLP